MGMKKKAPISRRDALKGLGVIGASAFAGSKAFSSAAKIPPAPNAVISSAEIRKVISEKVFKTPLIDVHEHLKEEKSRFKAVGDDWTYCFNDSYFGCDLLTAGMKPKNQKKFFSQKTDLLEKWSLLKPYWPFVKNTGYGQAICISIKELYGVSDVSEKTIDKIQSGYEKVRQPGFYKHILCDLASIESCQVNWLTKPFCESDMPTLLMQDLSILGMSQGPDFEMFGKPTGIKVSSLADWHKVIDWWFEKYAKYAVAVKSQQAYWRDIDFQKVPAEEAEQIFTKRLSDQPLTDEEKKKLEDHLFWYAVDKATKLNLPVKIHTGLYAGHDGMPLSRLMNNPGSATNLCKLSPETRFVFMHTCYPYYEPMIAAAKHWSNAYVDMSVIWIYNPVAAKDFLKKYLVTAPANKVFVFGGDYIHVEPVLGHAVLARRGITLALSELVEEELISLDNALELIDPIMHQNARVFFNLEEKTKILKDVNWQG